MPFAHTLESMGIIAAPVKSGEKNKNLKENKSFIADALQAKLRQVITTDDGRQLTISQLMAERLTNIAVYGESNTDAIAAQKLIYERVMGKAAVMKEEETRVMPKVVFSLSEDSLDKVNKSAEQIIKEAEIEDDGDGLIVAEIDGRTFVG